MKKSILYLVILFSLSITFLGCKDPDYTPTSYIKVDGVYYKLTQGFYSYDASDNTYDLILVDDSVKCNTFFEEFSGCSHGVIITLRSPIQSSVLAAENYEYSEQATGSYDYKNFVFTFHRDWATNIANYNHDVTHNNVSVEKSGETYTISFTGNDEFNNPYELKYIGKITPTFF
jgi:hypothetical protein